jgi:hypothetical protein
MRRRIMETMEFIESKCDAACSILDDFGPEKAMGYPDRGELSELP